MIDIRKDLFVRLVLAAKNRKQVERNASIEELKARLSGLETKDYDTPEVKLTPEKIEERVAQILRNDKYVEINKEIENAEKIFDHMKHKISKETSDRIAARITQLKNIVQKKMSAS